MAHAPQQSRDTGAMAGRQASAEAAVLSDLRPAAAVQRALQAEIHSGPVMTAQRQALQAMFGPRHVAAPLRVAGSPVAQLFGAISFANLDSAKAEYATKAQEIISTLQGTAKINTFLANKNTLITLEFNAQLATVLVLGDQVQITLSPWFFEKESSGKIVGMLIHEFGAHPLAMAAMTGPEQLQEQQDVALDTAFPTGVHGHTITPGQAGQQDHIFAAVSGQPRYREYRQTAFEAVSAMYQATLLHGATMTAAKVTDAIMTYLSDIAMILATNDHRGQIVLEPALTAQCFNVERTNWLAFLGVLATPTANALVGLTPGVKSKGDVLGEVASLGGSFFGSMFTKGTNNDRLKQGAAAVTPVQQTVLGDYGVVLQAGPTTHTLFQALDAANATASGDSLGDSIGAMMNHRALVGAGPLATRLKATEDLFSGAPTMGPLASDPLYLLAWSLGITIRVVLPSGKIQFGDGGGAVFTVLQVEKPAPHYRHAI